MTVQATRWDKNDPPVRVELATHKVVSEGNIARVESVMLYLGDPEALPDEHAVFTPAVLAACAKARAYHCRVPHYAAMMF